MRSSKVDHAALHLQVATKLITAHHLPKTQWGLSIGLVLLILHLADQTFSLWQTLQFKLSNLPWDPNSKMALCANTELSSL